MQSCFPGKLAVFSLEVYMIKLSRVLAALCSAGIILSATGPALAQSNQQSGLKVDVPATPDSTATQL